MENSPHAKWSRVAAALGAAMLLATTIPLGFVSADNQQGADGLVVVATPRAGTVRDGTLFMVPVANHYVFDFQLFHADGAPYLVTEYMVDINTVSKNRSGESNAGAAKLIWTDSVTTAPTSSGVVRIPVGPVAFALGSGGEATPVGGFTLTILPVRDASGTSLVVGGYLPGGQYSIAANELAAAGDFENADLADEGFTPIVALNQQLEGIVSAGNPFVNPGFEAPATSNSSVDNDFQGFKMPAAPWLLYCNVGTGTPESRTFYAGAESGGTSGGYVSVNYNQADAACKPSFGQLFTPPQGADGSPLAFAWYGSDSVKVSFDIKVRDGPGTTATAGWHGCTTLHYTNLTTEMQNTICPTVAHSANYEWTHVSYDFGSVADGMALTSFFLSFGFIASTNNPIVAVDNFVMTGATLAPAQVDLHNDGNDGFANFIVPYGASGISSSVEGVTQSLSGLAGGKAGYVYEVGVMDYTGLNPKEVDMGSLVNVFRLLDERSQVGGGSSTKNAFNTTGSAGNGQIFRFYEADGSVSKNLLIVADEAAFDAASTGSAIGAVPWLYTDVATSDGYTDTFGQTAEPASGYYSPARNNVISMGIADSMDYAATPLSLSGIEGFDMATPSTLTLTCPAQTATVACTVAPNPELEVTLTSDSSVIETLTVELVSAATDAVLGTATLPATGGVVSFTVSTPAMDAMTAAGDLTVFARTAGSVFVEGAETSGFKLDNLAPTASIAPIPSGLVKNSLLRLESRSTDGDGTITRAEWTVALVSDASPDGDTDTPGIVRSSEGNVVFVVIPDDGSYLVTLNAVDDGGAVDTTTALFTAANRAPTVSVSGPAAAMPGVVTFTYAAVDADDLIALVEIDDGMGSFAPAVLGTSFTTTLGAGVQTVAVRVTDGDGATRVASATIIIDGIAPTTLLAAPAAPASGWFNASVTFTVTPSDTGGSGVASTNVTIDGVSEIVTGSGAFSRTLTKDGVHTVTVRTTDGAGNLGLAESATIRIDASAPTVSITGPAMLPGGVINSFHLSGDVVEIVATVTENASPITQVVFFVDGGEPIFVDTSSVGGWTFTWEAAGTGVHTIDAIAYNAAGLSSAAETITVIVV